ncbi:MAG: sigma-70 family RNA polymerase sigma factor [Candidatus Aminicenantes bacterium]|nr:sigma-70 family RNA polymerase sigma factor [Candidatus Aminicenantes bacterium]
MEENALIQAARQGNMEAFRQLFDENRQRIFAVAFRYAKNVEDAEDILQDTFIKAYQGLEKFKVTEDTCFSAWLYRISINSSIDLLRKNRKMRDKYFDNDSFDNLSSNDDNHNPEHSNRIREVREKIDIVLETLTSRQRMIFILRHYQHLSTKEISEYMSCSQGSVKKQLFRAVSAVKTHFKNLIPEKSYEM